MQTRTQSWSTGRRPRFLQTATTQPGAHSLPIAYAAGISSAGGAHQGASDGEWLPWKYEREDGYDTIEWAAALPNSNGKVGMFGGNYLGSTQRSAAIAGAPHLTAIAPAITWSDPEDGLMFRGGAIELGLNTFWAMLTGIGQIPKAGLEPDDMMKRMMTTLGDMDTMPTQTYWQLPSTAHPSSDPTCPPTF